MVIPWGLVLRAGGRVGWARGRVLRRGRGPGRRVESRTRWAEPWACGRVLRRRRRLATSAGIEHRARRAVRWRAWAIRRLWTELGDVRVHGRRSGAERRRGR